MLLLFLSWFLTCNGTKWPKLCLCAVKKLLTHSLTLILYCAECPQYSIGLEALQKFVLFWKKRPLTVKLSKLPKVFIASPIDVLCSNFVKYGRWEIGEIMRCGRRRKFGDVSCTECRGQGMTLN